MSLTQAGPLCDVCGKYILLDRSLNPFRVNGIDVQLHCHDACRPIVERTKQWPDLPDGPLRRAFVEAHNAS